MAATGGGSRIDSLNSKHMLLALGVAAGKTNRELAEALDYNEQYVSQVKASPLFQAQLLRLQKDMTERTMSDVVGRIIGEADRSVDVLVELRDHAENEHVRLHSATEFLDRNPATRKVQKTESESVTKIVFSADDVRRMVQARAEAALPEARVVGHGRPAAGVVVLSVDEATAAAEQRAADRLADIEAA